jgi:hypothetical protein
MRPGNRLAIGEQGGCDTAELPGRISWTFGAKGQATKRNWFLLLLMIFFLLLTTSAKHQTPKNLQPKTVKTRHIRGICGSTVW